MKKLLFFVLLLIITISSNVIRAQVYAPGLSGQYGIRIITYPDCYYLGEVKNGIADGIGTFYYNDGSFYRGGYKNGLREGQGFLISPQYGYIVGCWSRDNYIGECYHSINPYASIPRIRREVQSVQTDRSITTRSNPYASIPRFRREAQTVQTDRSISTNNNDYTNVSPEGYNIIQIDPQTQMGRQLLGSYQGR